MAINSNFQSNFFNLFYSDSSTDMVTITDDNLMAKVYLWSDDNGFFHYFSNITVDKPIVSLIPGKNEF